MECYACNHPESTYAMRGLCRTRTSTYRGWGVLLKGYVRFPISSMKMLILSFVQEHHTPLPSPPLPSPWRLTLSHENSDLGHLTSLRNCHACIFRMPCPKTMIFPFLKVGTYAPPVPESPYVTHLFALQESLDRTNNEAIAGDLYLRVLTLECLSNVKPL